MKNCFSFCLVGIFLLSLLLTAAPVSAGLVDNANIFGNDSAIQSYINKIASNTGAIVMIYTQENLDTDLNTWGNTVGRQLNLGTVGNPKKNVLIGYFKDKNVVYVISKKDGDVPYSLKEEVSQAMLDSITKNDNAAFLDALKILEEGLSSGEGDWDPEPSPEPGPENKTEPSPENKTEPEPSPEPSSGCALEEVSMSDFTESLERVSKVLGKDINEAPAVDSFRDLRILGNDECIGKRIKVDLYCNENSVQEDGFEYHLLDFARTFEDIEIIDDLGLRTFDQGPLFLSYNIFCSLEFELDYGGDVPDSYYEIVLGDSKKEIYYFILGDEGEKPDPAPWPEPDPEPRPAPFEHDDKICNTCHNDLDCTVQECEGLTDEIDTCYFSDSNYCRLCSSSRSQYGGCNEYTEEDCDSDPCGFGNCRWDELFSSCTDRPEPKPDPEPSPDNGDEDKVENLCSYPCKAGCNIPESFTWTNHNGRNWMTSVKHQRTCGSCWAFTSLGTIEAMYNIEQGTLKNIDASEQDLVSCSGVGGCDGGWPNNAFRYIRDNGVTEEDCFEYRAEDLSCSIRCDSYSSKKWKISDYKIVNNYGDTVQRAIVCGGPLATAIIPYDPPTYPGGHGVVIVGYDNPNREFIYKNSWGVGWESGGYGRVGYNRIGDMQFSRVSGVGEK